MVHAVQSNQQYDVHAGVANSTADPAADRLRLLAGVDCAAVDHRPRWVLPERQQPRLRGRVKNTVWSIGKLSHGLIWHRTEIFGV